jgi:hypothetical protein
VAFFAFSSEKRQILRATNYSDLGQKKLNPNWRRAFHLRLPAVASFLGALCSIINSSILL